MSIHEVYAREIKQTPAEITDWYNRLTSELGLLTAEQTKVYCMMLERVVGGGHFSEETLLDGLKERKLSEKQIGIMSSLLERMVAGENFPDLLTMDMEVKR